MIKKISDLNIIRIDNKFIDYFIIIRKNDKFDHIRIKIDHKFTDLIIIRVCHK